MMKRTMTLAALLAGLLLSAAVARAERATVIDGDTLTIGERTFRLYGIDAPEHGQKCARHGGGSWQCGKAATERLSDLVAGRDVRCETYSHDAYGREIAVCTADGKDLNEQMVREGLAWAFVRYTNRYSDAEAQARGRGRGIWQAETRPAWEYRADRWARAVDASPNGCPIKGNISKNGRIYHTPWSPWYSRTKINTEKGERWFCDEAEARAAGWRAPLWGR